MQLSIKNPEQMVRNMWPHQYAYDFKGSVYMEVGIPGRVSNLLTWVKESSEILQPSHHGVHFLKIYIEWFLSMLTKKRWVN